MGTVEQFLTSSVLVNAFSDVPAIVRKGGEVMSPHGTMDPDQIHTPGIFVKRIVRCPSYEKRIEQRTVRKRGS